MTNGRGATSARKREIDARRGSACARGYDRRWRKVRVAVLAGEPLCRFCAERGQTTPATQVDHIDGNSRNNARANLRPLCASCHSSRTARDQGIAAGKGAGYRGDVGPDGWPIDPEHPWNKDGGAGPKAWGG